MCPQSALAELGKAEFKDDEDFFENKRVNDGRLFLWVHVWDVVCGLFGSDFPSGGNDKSASDFLGDAGVRGEQPVPAPGNGIGALMAGLRIEEGNGESDGLAMTGRAVTMGSSLLSKAI